MTKTTEQQKLRRFGLDCWGWRTVVLGVDEEDARARAIKGAGSRLYAEMAEMANIRPLTDARQWPLWGPLVLVIFLTTVLFLIGHKEAATVMGYGGWVVALLVSFLIGPRRG